MATSSTKTGMSNYKFRRPEMTLDDVITPEIRAKNMKMLEEAKDAKTQALTEKAYEAASKNSLKHGGKVKKMANGGSASKRADGIAIKGKTRGKVC